MTFDTTLIHCMFFCLHWRAFSMFLLVFIACSYWHLNPTQKRDRKKGRKILLIRMTFPCSIVCPFTPHRLILCVCGIYAIIKTYFLFRRSQKCCDFIDHSSDKAKSQSKKKSKNNEKCLLNVVSLLAFLCMSKINYDKCVYFHSIAFYFHFASILLSPVALTIAHIHTTNQSHLLNIHCFVTV